MVQARSEGSTTVPALPRAGVSAITARIRSSLILYAFLLPSLAYFLIFHYVPMYGLQIAFRDYMPTRGFFGSPWVGLEHLRRFLLGPRVGSLLWNTLTLSFGQLIIGFPVPIILALLLNQLANVRYKRFVQTLTYAPRFISLAVMVGMLNVFLSPHSGIVNALIKAVGSEPVFFMGRPDLFRSVFIVSGIWQFAGWGAIIYLAALTGVSPELYDAAVVDGASKLKRILYIDIPGIMPTVTVVLLLRLGQLMNAGFQKALLMQNALNLGVSELINTYVYKQGLLQGNFSYATAIGLFNTLVNLLLLLTFNSLAKRIGQEGIW